MRKKIDITGERYGRLVVIRELSKNSIGETMWLCQCDCGRLIILRGSSLRSGNTRSCGCLKGESLKTRGITHNGTGTRLYHIWANMIQRCTNENNKCWARYGGRGITVCDEWFYFTNFKKWALENGYSENLSIDRINVNKGYSPTNCRWSDSITQANNKRTNHYIDYRGRNLTISQWATLLQISPKTISTRLQRGWSVERTLTTPIKKGKNNDT